MPVFPEYRPVLFFSQAEDGIRDHCVTGVQTCGLPIFRAGVLFGDEVKELLEYAKANQFALPAINCIGTGTVNAALAAAREVNSPTMIQFSNGGAQFFIGKHIPKENQNGPILGGIAGAHYVDAAAKAYGVPVILNTDHCAKKLLPWVDGLLAASEEQFAKTGKPLYSSHMLDLS